jgi:hypothetical protein
MSWEKVAEDSRVQGFPAKNRGIFDKCMVFFILLINKDLLSTITHDALNP